MKVEGHEAVDVAPALAWQMINDPAVLKGCTPGLEILTETTKDHYEAEIALQMPLLKGRFTGSVDIVERVEPERLRLRLQGKGAPGFVNGEATLHLSAAGAGTAFRYEADVTIGGQIARLGQRMISGVTKEMAGQFFEAFAQWARVEEARARTTAAGAPAGTGGELPAHRIPSPLRAFLQLVWRTLLNLLGVSRRS